MEVTGEQGEEAEMTQVMAGLRQSHRCECPNSLI
jgi:hypothetical protein